MMLEGRLPLGAVLHLPEHVLLPHAPRRDLEVLLGARAPVQVPVHHLEDAEERQEDKGFDADHGELIAPEDYLLQGCHVRYRY